MKDDESMDVDADPCDTHRGGAARSREARHTYPAMPAAPSTCPFCGWDRDCYVCEREDRSTPKGE